MVSSRSAAGYRRCASLIRRLKRLHHNNKGKTYRFEQKTRTAKSEWMYRRFQNRRTVRAEFAIYRRTHFFRRQTIDQTHLSDIVIPSTKTKETEKIQNIKNREVLL